MATYDSCHVIVLNRQKLSHNVSWVRLWNCWIKQEEKQLSLSSRKGIWRKKWCGI